MSPSKNTMQTNLEKHAELVKTLSEFDLVDIGQRVPELPDDLKEAKNILVTGGAGFIGSFLVRKLVVLYPEYHIYVIDKLDYCGSLHNLKAVKEFPNYTFVRGDITCVDFITFFLKEKKIDVIFHLAAQTHVDNSFGDSFEFTKNNVMGTHVLLEAAKSRKIMRFVHVSTDEVYGEIVNGPDCPEDTILQPTNPYSATKAAAECLVKAYHMSFGLPIMITRSNNVYGPYQFPEKITSKFVCSLLRGKKCYIHGDGQNSRKYLYAADVVNAIDIIFHKGLVGETYNIGSPLEITNLEMARRLILLFGYTEEQVMDHIEFVRDRAHNDKRYAIDCSKIEKLGWSPKVKFDEGLLKTIEWYRQCTDTWWGDDISSALIPHPFKVIPSYDVSSV
ncbi:hypothetical protein BD408DRAFT_425680 [Parasitella parasitica]|nr:hypothetical protein BD408DRAFT_425680 [Parasitella parasitica]